LAFPLARAWKRGLLTATKLSAGRAENMASWLFDPAD
jgi:hypothetical protein